MAENHYLEALLLVQTGEYLLQMKSCKDPGSRPELPEAYELQGVIAANENNNEEAVKHFERALELGADTATLHLNLAQALRKLGRNEESEEHMEAYRRLSRKK